MFVSDIANFAELNKIYAETFSYVNPSTRACLQVPFSENCPVRIEALSWKFPMVDAGETVQERYANIFLTS